MNKSEIMNKDETIIISQTIKAMNIRLKQIQLYSPVYLTDGELNCGVIEFNNK